MAMVFLDSNFCTLPFQRRIDVVESIKSLIPNVEILVPDFIISELEKISVKEKTARMALKFIDENEDIDVFWTGLNPKNIDSALLSLGEEHKAVIATNDKKLRVRLKKNGIKSVFLRQNSVLSLG